MEHLFVPVSGLEFGGSKQATQALSSWDYSQTQKDDIKAITAVTYSGLQGCAGGYGHRAQDLL